MSAFDEKKIGYRKQPAYPCDLHTHTNRSDGHDTPKELIDRAAILGLMAVAITDHDTVPPATVEAAGQPVNINDYAASKGITLLPGMEISCDTNNEDVHIIGLGCDWNDPYFRKLEKEVQNSKVESYRQLVDRLDGNGFPMVWEEVLKATGNWGHSETIQKKQIFEYMAELGHADSWQAAKKLVQADEFYSVKRRKPAAFPFWLIPTLLMKPLTTTTLK